MISKTIVLAAVIAVAVAHYIPEPVHYAPKPYAFGYSVKDHHGEQHREESGTGGHSVKGSYGFTDARGVRREVEYVADGAGFRANVKTNEPGTANQSPAAVTLHSDAAHPYGPAEHGFLLTPGAGYGGLGGYAAGAGLGYAGLGYGAPGLGYAGLGYGSFGLGGLGYARYGY